MSGRSRPLILPVHAVESPPVRQWLTNGWRMGRLTREGSRISDSAVKYLWAVAKSARTQDEVEDFSVALGIFGAIRAGWSKPVLAAYYYVLGMHPFRFIRFRLERHARMEWELAALTKRARPKGRAVVVRMPVRARRRSVG